MVGVGGDVVPVAPPTQAECGGSHPPEPADEARVLQPLPELGQVRSRRQLTQQGVAPDSARVVREVEAPLREGRTDRLCHYFAVGEREGDPLAKEWVDP